VILRGGSVAKEIERLDYGSGKVERRKSLESADRNKNGVLTNLELRGPSHSRRVCRGSYK
jgi:hypothetical protein